MRNVVCPPPLSQFICLVPTPRALCGIHSFKCWSQGPALRIETHTGSTIFRIKEWDGERSILGVGLTGPGRSHTPYSMLHRFCCCCCKWTIRKTITNKTIVHMDAGAADILCTCRMRGKVWFKLSPCLKQDNKPVLLMPFTVIFNLHSGSSFSVTVFYCQLWQEVNLLAHLHSRRVFTLIYLFLSQ